MAGDETGGPSDTVLLRAGVAGYGMSGEVFHCPLIDATPGIEVAKIVTSDRERSARATVRYPEAEVVPDISGV